MCFRYGIVPGDEVTVKFASADEERPGHFKKEEYWEERKCDRNGVLTVLSELEQDNPDIPSFLVLKKAGRFVQVVENGQPTKAEICPVAFEDGWTNGMLALDSYCEKFKAAPEGADPRFQEASMVITATKNRYYMIKAEQDKVEAERRAQQRK